MIAIWTERLVIRNFDPGDGPALHEMIVQYEASGLAAYDQPWPTAPEAVQQAAAWFAGGDSFLAVCLKDTGRLIGLVALNPEGEADRHEFNLGYVFNFDYHGRGYATEACRAALDHAFERLGAQRVVSGTAAANGASCRLLGRLGFRRTGESTASFRKTDAGEPIEFVGYRFELAREAW